MAPRTPSDEIGMVDLPDGPSGFPIRTISQLITEKGRANRDETFLVDPETGDELTYGAVLEGAETVATSLAELGVQQGDRVATVLPNSLDHVVIWFGVMLRGAVWAPINDTFTTDELRHAVSQVDPSAIVLSPTSAERYQETGLTVDVELETGTPTVAKTSADVLFEGPRAPPDVEIRPGDPSILVFTGGTTGMPKPVLYPHFAPLTGAYRYRHIYGTTPEDRHMVVLRLYHMAGQQFGFLGPMMSDMSTVVPEQFSASRFFEQVNAHGVTISDPTGSMVGILLKTHDGPVQNTLRWIASGWLNRETPAAATERFDVDLMGGWAQSETGGCKLLHLPFVPDQEIAYPGEPVGTAGEWAEIAIHDEENEPVEPGTVGELCIRPTIAHSMMKCYFNNPEATVETWDGLWIHTGDLAVVDEEGLVYFVGRQSHFLRVKGENVSAGEVERVIDDHPAVHESAIVGLPDEDIGGDEIKAFVVLEEDLSPEALVQWLEGRISEYKIPRYVEFIDGLPRTETKETIQRNVLRDRGNDDAWTRER